jgi:acetyl-CoA acetyltransferase
MTGVAVSGVGMTAFGRYPDRSLGDLGAEAVRAALADAEVGPAEVQAAFVANAMGGLVTGQASVVGQVVLERSGIAGIPVFNIDNACAGSAAALRLGVTQVASGEADTVLVVGVERIYHPDRAVTYRALNGAADVEWADGTGVALDTQSVFMTRVYPARLEAYAAAHGLEPETLARIAVKNRRHAGANPLAQYRSPLTVDEVLASRAISPPLTALMCAPIGDGASAAVLRRNGATGRRGVPIRASVVLMGRPGGNGVETVRIAGERAYAAAGLGPDEVDVAEVHDATAFTELLGYEGLGFCAAGEAAALVRDGTTSLGGGLPVNTSGGLESRGHPVAATGLAQVHELVAQLRGEAGERQVEGARIGLAEIAGGYVGGDSASVAVHVLGGG